jgi:hypothetical protein
MMQSFCVGKAIYSQLGKSAMPRRAEFPQSPWLRQSGQSACSVFAHLSHLQLLVFKVVDRF